MNKSKIKRKIWETIAGILALAVLFTFMFGALVAYRLYNGIPLDGNATDRKFEFGVFCIGAALGGYLSIQIVDVIMHKMLKYPPSKNWLSYFPKK